MRMASPKDHYEIFLAERYSWMFGDFDARLDSELARLKSLGIKTIKGGLGVDPCCGAGTHAIALARLCYSVEAIDFSETLLAELEERRDDLAVNPIPGDMLDAAALVAGPVDVVLCMGDTFVHLQSHGELRRFMSQCAEILKPGGHLVLSFRDLCQEAEGLDRFITVRETEQRIMTCFLEYEGLHVKVHDLFYEHENGHWRLDKSMCRKLRLSLGRAAELSENAGFAITLKGAERGTAGLVARRLD